MQGPFARTIGIFAILGLGLGWCVLCGCAAFGGASATESGSSGPPPSPVQHALLQNIPLPVGFKMVPERSVARESGRFRVAQCEFEGSSSPEEVTRFYINYMPSANFVLKQKRYDSGEYTLRFESDAEECNIRARSGKLSSTTLVVDVGPLPKGTADREEKRPHTRR